MDTHYYSWLEKTHLLKEISKYLFYCVSKYLKNATDKITSRNTQGKGAMLRQALKE